MRCACGIDSPRWIDHEIARQYREIKHLRLLTSVTRVHQQPVDQLCPLLGVGVAQKRRRFLVDRDHADEVEMDSPQEHGIRRTLRCRDLRLASCRLDFAIDDLAQGIITLRQSSVVGEQRE